MFADEFRSVVDLDIGDLMDELNIEESDLFARAFVRSNCVIAVIR